MAQLILTWNTKAKSWQNRKGILVTVIERTFCKECGTWDDPANGFGCACCYKYE